MVCLYLLRCILCLLLLWFLTDVGSFKVILSGLFCLFFFFKRNTAYELRIGDWSSYVCSSDLVYLLSDPVRHSLCGRIDPTDGRRRRVTDRSRPGVVRWNNIRARISPRSSRGSARSRKCSPSVPRSGP